MNQQPCQLCGATTPRTQQTPTLFGVRPLCARCRDLYCCAVVIALGEFRHGEQLMSPPSFSQAQEAA